MKKNQKKGDKELYDCVPIPKTETREILCNATTTTTTQAVERTKERKPALFMPPQNAALDFIPPQKIIEKEERKPNHVAIYVSENTMNIKS